MIFRSVHYDEYLSMAQCQSSSDRNRPFSCAVWTDRSTTMRITLLIALFICGALAQDEEAPKDEKAEPESTTQAEDYEEEGDDCEDGGLFEIFFKIICIFKLIIGLLTGNSDPCCPLEIPSLGR